MKYTYTIVPCETEYQIHAISNNEPQNWIATCLTKENAEMIVHRLKLAERILDGLNEYISGVKK